MVSNGDSTREKIDTLRMASDIIVAYVSNNSLPINQLSGAITVVHNALAGLQDGGPKAPAKIQKPAVPINRSIKPDYVVCLEDGRKLKMLKRHLRTRYGMSPEEYRIKWGLPADYPMVAPNYSSQRSAFARKIGLGRKSTGRKKKTKK
jgi:predicted transcriptional regulator